MTMKRGIPLDEARAARKAVHVAFGDPMMLMRIRTERSGEWMTPSAELRFHVPSVSEELALKAATGAVDSVRRPVRVQIVGPGNRVLATLEGK